MDTNPDGQTTSFGRRQAALMTAYYLELARLCPRTARYCSTLHARPESRMPTLCWFNISEPIRQTPYEAFRRSAAVVGRRNTPELARLVAQQLMNADITDCYITATNPGTKAIQYATKHRSHLPISQHASQISVCARDTIQTLIRARDELTAALASTDLDRYLAAIRQAATAQIRLLAVTNSPVPSR